MDKGHPIVLNSNSSKLTKNLNIKTKTPSTNNAKGIHCLSIKNAGNSPTNIWLKQYVRTIIFENNSKIKLIR